MRVLMGCSVICAADSKGGRSQGPTKDGKVKSFTDHEDSVYSAFPSSAVMPSHRDTSNSCSLDNGWLRMKANVKPGRARSCTGVAWSSSDPWTFASLSYDGRVAINTVSSQVKYKILI
jgi:hypothetical protein